MQYPVPGEHVVEKGHPRYLAPGDPNPDSATDEPLTAGRVYISRDMPRRGQHGQYFAGIPPEVWDFHVGGYQVCDKWLKDRRGRTLTYDDIEHYGRIVTALQETIRLMSEIDAAIPTWPLLVGPSIRMAPNYFDHNIIGNSRLSESIHVPPCFCKLGVTTGGRVTDFLINHPAIIVNIMACEYS